MQILVETHMDSDVVEISDQYGVGIYVTEILDALADIADPKRDLTVESNKDIIHMHVDSMIEMVMQKETT